MITLSNVLLFLAGLVYGGIIGFFGHKIMNAALMRKIPTNDREVRLMKRRITTRWWIRLTVDALSLFVLFKLPAMLIGAGLGIVLFQKVLIVKYIKKDK
jgi:uncharacterized protein YneF (UPF0154 family)